MMDITTKGTEFTKKIKRLRVTINLLISLNENLVVILTKRRSILNRKNI